MKIHIRETDGIDMTLGNNGLLLGVSDTKGNHTGKLRIGKAKITWHEGKSPAGIPVNWDELIKFFENKITSK
jgi:hypothetical protein